MPPGGQPPSFSSDCSSLKEGDPAWLRRELSKVPHKLRGYQGSWAQPRASQEPLRELDPHTRALGREADPAPAARTLGNCPGRQKYGQKYKQTTAWLEGGLSNAQTLPGPSRGSLLPSGRSPSPSAQWWALVSLPGLPSLRACGAQPGPSLCLIVSHQTLLLLQGPNIAGLLLGEMANLGSRGPGSGSTASPTCFSRAGAGAAHLCVPSKPTSGPVRGQSQVS